MKEQTDLENEIKGIRDKVDAIDKENSQMSKELKELTKMSHSMKPVSILDDYAIQKPTRNDISVTQESATLVNKTISMEAGTQFDL